MNLKIILLTALLVTVLMGMMNFGYLTWSLFNMAAPNQAVAGDVIVKDHLLMFSTQAVFYVLTFGLGVGVFYKA